LASNSVIRATPDIKFMVYCGVDATSYSNGWTKASKWDAVEMNIGGGFDSIRQLFQPGVIGVYLMTFRFVLTSTTQTRAAIYKNGALHRSGAAHEVGGPTACASEFAGLVTATATTDYFEAYFYNWKSSGTSAMTVGRPYVSWEGQLLLRR